MPIGQKLTLLDLKHHEEKLLLFGWGKFEEIFCSSSFVEIDEHEELKKNHFSEKRNKKISGYLEYFGKKTSAVYRGFNLLLPKLTNCKTHLLSKRARNEIFQLTLSLPSG